MQERHKHEKTKLLAAKQEELDRIQLGYLSSMHAGGEGRGEAAREGKGGRGERGGGELQFAWVGFDVDELEVEEETMLSGGAAGDSETTEIERELFQPALVSCNRL